MAIYGTVTLLMIHSNIATSTSSDSRGGRDVGISKNITETHV